MHIPSSPLTAFLDESGNTGRNYLDLRQPFYILGGWAIDHDKEASCREIFSEWESRFPAYAQGAEVKSSSVLKMADGIKRSINLANSLIAEGAVPTCCVFEKRFGICINLAETFFPAPTVLEADHTLTLPEALARRDLANFLYTKLSDDLLTQYANAVNKQDLDTFAHVQEDLFHELLDLGATKLISHLPLISPEEFSQFPFSGSNRENSINATVFHTQLMMLEHLSRIKSCPAWDLLHDETATFEEIMRITVKHFSKMPTQAIHQTNGLTLYFGNLRLNRMDFKKSNEEALIRCADHYVGVLHSFFKSLLIDDFKNIEEARNLKRLLFATACGEPALKYFTTSDKIDYKLKALV